MRVVEKQRDVWDYLSSLASFDFWGFTVGKFEVIMNTSTKCIFCDVFRSIVIRKSFSDPDPLQ